MLCFNNLFFEGDADEIYKMDPNKRNEILALSNSPSRLMSRLEQEAPFFATKSLIASRGSAAIDDVLAREQKQNTLNLTPENRQNLTNISSTFKKYSSGELKDLPD